MDPRPPTFYLYPGHHSVSLHGEQHRKDSDGYYRTYKVAKHEGVSWAELPELWETYRTRWPKASLSINLPGNRRTTTIRIGGLSWSVLYGMVFMSLDRLVSSDGLGCV